MKLPERVMNTKWGRRSLSLPLLTLLAMLPTGAARGAERCAEPVATAVSVQGVVEGKTADAREWRAVALSDTFCPGDMVRIRERGRAAVVLSNETVLRLDEKTTVTFTEMTKERRSIVELLSGAAHFFSRLPRSLKVLTPFVNGGVEGTEFFVRVEDDHTLLTVFQGRVVAENETGSLALGDGQSAVARRGAAPAAHTVVRPRDAVQWSLYYPPITDVASGAAGGEPDRLTRQAALDLAVGRVEEAKGGIEKALVLDPQFSGALALKAVVAVTGNANEEAIDLARRAVESDPKSASALIALSYARQAVFDIEGALASLRQAVEAEPQNAVAWARLSEMWLATGSIPRAVEAARKAADLQPGTARAQSVLGFAYLAELKTAKAQETFHQAILLDQAAPLPRLGLGLATIREGNLEAGRREIEIAVSLDPGRSILRSYVGKAYFDEKRDDLAESQYAVARELDPRDPTPWFYGAVGKQARNRPVEALRDNQESIRLNDNRAVYRSRLLLDDDLAARSAGLARIYRDLGFEQLALAEGYKSVGADEGSYSAHRFLADTYAVLPRHELARVSELLQSQLLQPINVTPVQPQLAETNLFILEGAGPADPSFNEFHPLFFRNRFALQASGVAGSNDTLGDEIVHSAVLGPFSYSLGQFHYETDGFRENNDLEQDIYNAFAQVQLSPATSLQGEVRYNESDQGDLALTFTDFFNPDLREEEQVGTLRLGGRHDLSPRATVLASYIYHRADIEVDVIPGFVNIAGDIDSHLGELRFLYRSNLFSLTGGAGYIDVADTMVSTFAGFPAEEDVQLDHTNVYLYSTIDLPQAFSVTLGASGDFLDGATDEEDKDQFNPKFGLTWNPVPATTLRAAAFRTLQRPFLSQQTIDPTLEPTQVAGFNQFFFAAEGDEAWRYGVALDQVFSPALYAGAELSARDLEVRIFDATGPVPALLTRDWKERMARAYLYWTPLTSLALRVEYLYEDFDREAEGGFTGTEQFTELRTHRVPLGARYFHPCGFMGGLTATYVDQEGDFTVPGEMGPGFSLVPGDDRFWVVDASLGYRLPKRYGIVSLEGKNLFDEEFNFQDTDPGNPRIMPDRMILLRLTFSF